MTTKTKHGTRWLCTTALLMAMNIIMSMSVFSVPVPGGHLYLNDVIICFAALILDPLGAFCVGGVGAFLGDFFFYPTPMFVSLVTHGLQAVAISLCAHRMMKEKPVIASLIGVLLGAVIMVVGYSLGRAFIYATPAAAICTNSFGSALSAMISSRTPRITIIMEPSKMPCICRSMSAKTRTDSRNARKIARPPMRGMGTLCMRRLSLGTSIAPTL